MRSDDNVIALHEHRPHWTGECLCLDCKHTWQGVGPVGEVHGLECPNCGQRKGVTRNLIGAPHGSLVLSCAKCGSEALTAFVKLHKDTNNSYGQVNAITVLCMCCGTDLTAIFYNPFSG